MSITWRTVASAKALPFSSGTYWVTTAFWSICPSATSIAAMVPKKDLVSDCARCCPSGLNTPA